VGGTLCVWGGALAAFHLVGWDILREGRGILREGRGMRTFYVVRGCSGAWWAGCPQSGR
jgi:hypothetical protein